MKTKSETVERAQSLTDLGFSLQVLSGPSPGVDEGGQADWPHIAFTLRLCYKGAKVLDTDYKLGVGYVRPQSSAADMARMYLSNEQETLLFAWVKNPQADFKDKLLWASVASKLATIQKVAPTLADVIHSLLLDGEAFFSAQSFEDWARDFGYEEDSRKAEQIYRACDDIGRKLANGIPKNVLDQAREIVKDL